MKLENLNFRQLLPAFMRPDSANQALASGIDKIIPNIAAQVQLLSTWDHIHELDEQELDQLAWELNILWYDYGADIQTKRDLVKNSDLVYRRLGTKWAAESVIRSYFTKGHVTEWFEYDGKPGTFRICATAQGITQDKIDKFISLLRKVKRASAQLERMEIENPPLETTLYIGGTLVPSYQETSLPQYQSSKTLHTQAGINGALGSIVTIKLPPLKAEGE